MAAENQIGQKLPQAESDAREERLAGTSVAGTVDLRAFDEGVVRTLRAEIMNTPSGQNYFVNVEGVSPPPDSEEFPGIPVTFAYPEDIFEKHSIPVIVVRRDDISAAMQRWHADGNQQVTPAPGAKPLTVTIPTGRLAGDHTYFDRVEIRRQAEPVDIMYTVSVIARHRQGIGARREANQVFQHVLGVFNAYGSLRVVDSVGDTRLYEVFREGISMLDDLPEVSGRVIGFAITLRVEAELDLVGPKEFRTATTLPGFGTNGTMSLDVKS